MSLNVIFLNQPKRRVTMKKLFVLLLFFVIWAPLPAMAQWKIDPVHTNFYFEVSHT